MLSLTVVHESRRGWSVLWPGVLLQEDEHSLPDGVDTGPHHQPPSQHCPDPSSLPGQEVAGSVEQAQCQHHPLHTTAVIHHRET